MERNDLIDPDMSNQQMRLHFGEMTAQEMRTARAAIRFANSRASTTIASLSEALTEAEKKGAEAEDAKKAERHRIFRLLWDHSEHVNAYSLGLLIKDDASVTKALPPRDLSQGGQHG